MSGVAVSFAASARDAADAVASAALARIAEEPGGDVMAWNPSPHERRDCVEVVVPRAALPAAPGSLAFRNDGESLPCQLVADDGESVRMAFAPRLPAFGVVHYRLVAAPGGWTGAPSDPGSRLIPRADGSLEIRGQDGAAAAAGLHFTCHGDGGALDSRASPCSVRWLARGPVLGRIAVEGSILGVPNPAIILLVCVAVTYVILEHTLWGRYTYALGSNLQAAVVSGIKTDRYLILVYTFAGFLAAVAAIVLTARIGSGQPGLGLSYELDAIAASVIGGTSLAGGLGSAGGTLIGALIIGVMKNGLDILNVSADFQQVARAIIIVVAVTIDMRKNVRRD